MASEALLIISDASNVHYLAEDHIDEWWRSLPTARKVELFEAELEGRHHPASLLPPLDVPALTAHFGRFLEDMQRQRKSPLTGLVLDPEARRATV